MKGVFSCIMFILFLVAHAEASYYTVKKGDNLYDIARKLGTTTEALKESNGLNSHKLSIGMKLRVPGSAHSVTEPESNQSPAASRDRHEDARTIHTVKDGDTLYSLSREYGVPSDSIRKANKLSSHNLKIGMKLTIPKIAKKIPDTSPSDVSATDSGAAQKKNRSGTGLYIVRKGDSLDGIARKQGIAKKDLIALNGLSKKNLTVGQKLIVRKTQNTAEAEERIVSYKVKKGDTMQAIARRHGITVDELQSLNSLSSTRLRPGQSIVVARTTQTPAHKETPLDAVIATGGQKPPTATAERIAYVKAIAESEDISHLSVTDRLILFAKKMLHLPYKFGGNGSIGLDCSAFVQKVYDFAGIDLPRSAREQFKVGEAVDKEELSIGDLVFFRTYASFPSHVGIYLGNNLFIHASSKSKKVTIDSLDTPYYVKRYIGAKRLLSEGDIH